MTDLRKMGGKELVQDIWNMAGFKENELVEERAEILRRLAGAATSEGMKPEEPKFATNAVEQRQIDIINLRLYARLAEENEWHDETINWSVFQQTLDAIATRLERLPLPALSPARSGEPPTQAASLWPTCNFCGTELEKHPSGAGICPKCGAMKFAAASPSEPSAPQASAEPQPLPCRTPGAVYHFKLAHSEQSGREMLTLHVYMPQEISIVEKQAQAIEEKLHDACEEILSAYWPDAFAAAPQPVSGDAPKVEEMPLARKAAYALAYADAVTVDEMEAILRPYFSK